MKPRGKQSEVRAKPRPFRKERGKSGAPGADAAQAKAIIAEPLLVEIEKPIYGGAFLARLEGKAVFVPLALPGEQARVRVTESKPGYAAAEVEEIVRLPALWRLRRLPLSAHRLRNSTGFQAGHPARDAGARRRACAGGDVRAGR
jgi:predicted RNA-binding protein with TRAM domain